MPDFRNRRVMRRRLLKKQDTPKRFPGILGDGLGNLLTGTDNRVYVRVNGQVATAICDTIPAVYDLPVIVGRSIYQPHVYRVLEIRVYNSQADIQALIGKHAETHRYFGSGPGGGTDLLAVDTRQISQLRLYSDSDDGFVLHVVPGQVYIDGAPVIIGTYDAEAETITPEEIDLTDYVVTTADKAKIVLISIDDSGSVVVTDGSEVDTDALDWTSDTPAPPAGWRWILGAVRMYYGQTGFVEHRDNPDIIDFRWPMPHSHTGDELGMDVDDLGDVEITSAADGEVLVWDETSEKWINQTLEEAGISAVGHDHDSDYAPISHVSDTDNPHEVTAEQLGIKTQYRQFVWSDDGAGGWEFISAGGEPVLHLQDLE